MAGKKGDNSKKVAGNARKAEAAAQKQAANDARQEAAEEEKWNKGAKNNSKKEAQAAKAAEAEKKKAAAQKQAANDARQEAAEEEKWNKGAKNNSKKEAQAAKAAEAEKKKAEKAALQAEDDANTPGKAPKKSKAPVKKSRGLDLAQLDGDDKPSAISASGIDNALDALALTGGKDDKVDRHPERRYPAAYAKYEERRLEEMKKDGSGVGLRLDQRKTRIRKEFEKHPDNPFNQVTASYNATRDDVATIRAQEKAKIEQRLGH